MHLSVLLEMALGLDPDRVVGSDGHGTLTADQLRTQALATAQHLQLGADDRLIFVGRNSLVVPTVLFAAAVAGVPLVPLNYRLVDADLRRVAERGGPGVAVVDDDMVGRLDGVLGLRVVSASTVVSHDDAAGNPVSFDAGQIAAILFTSGTTGEPKAAVLRHSHLMAYVMSTLEFGSAAADEAALVSVPSYHIAGLSAIVSSLFTGRRIAYLSQFTPEGWVDAVVSQNVTHAMVVPTMLGRILDVLAERGIGLPALRHLSYGGGRMPIDVIERALTVLPDVAFVNAYGLTETSSTIALLGPEDHRLAFGSTDPSVRERLGSVGRPSPSVEVSIRDDAGVEVPAGVSGEIWVRGDQVSGEYLGRAGSDASSWFRTNDGGHFDDSGFLFVQGRLDDVIVRGGENISPGAIEDVLRSHKQVVAAAVVAVPSTEWGEAVAAVVVCDGEPVDADELRQMVRDRLRSTMAPERIEFRSELPYNDTGKLLRRVLRDELVTSDPAAT